MIQIWCEEKSKSSHQQDIRVERLHLIEEHVEEGTFVDRDTNNISPKTIPLQYNQWNKTTYRLANKKASNYGQNQILLTQSVNTHSESFIVF